MTDLREAIALTLCNFDSVRLDVPTMETINDFRFQVDRDVYLGMADAVLAILPDAEALADALEPFAECCEQIRQDEDDEEWAKFRLLIKDYRRAHAALANYRKGTGREG